MGKKSVQGVSMFKMFYNPELKKSTYTLLVTMALFVMVLLFAMNQVFIYIKEDYVSSQAAVVGALINKHPELQHELVLLVTKGLTGDQEQKGLEVLKEYGYTKQLDTIYLPKIRQWMVWLVLVIALVVSLFLLVLLLLNVLQYRTIYSKVNQLSLLTKDVLENRYDTSLPSSTEGDFSYLFDRFDQMRLALKGNMMALQKEKKFLVQLLSDITHQLKTPLASLILFIEIMNEKKISAEQRKTFLKNSHQQLERMEWLIQAFLKLAKLDAGAIMLKKEMQSLNETILRSIDLLRGKAHQKGVEVEFETNGNINIPHDRQWLGEAVVNIIENAIEHTPVGGCVKIVVEDTPLHFKIRIQDNGEGIERVELSKIFQRFYQGSNRKKGNTVGVGLSLSNTIVEAHDGYIEVESEKGKGSIFSLVFWR